MPSRSTLLCGAALVVAGLVWPLSAGAAGPSGNGSPSVLRDVQASSYDVQCPAAYQADCHPSFPVDGSHVQQDTQIEPSIAVNPSDPLNAVAAFQEGRVDAGGDATNGFATTLDGGKTWVHGMLPNLTIMTGATADNGGSTFDRASDAVVTFGVNPAHATDPTQPAYLVYANSLVFDDGTNSGDSQGLKSGMAINVSHDGGVTWSNPIVLEADNGAGLNDKNWLVVDNGTGVGHHPGRVYVVWDRVAPMVYAYCDPDVVTSAVTGAGCDKLTNWSNAPQNNGAWYTFNPGPGIGSIPLVLPDGSLGIMFEGDFGGTPAISSTPTDQPDVSVLGSQIMFAEAPGAGAVPFPAPLTFTQAAVGIASNQSTCCAQQRAGTLPAAVVDSTGRILVAWEDSRFRTDGLNDILVASSTDGVTWTPAARVNDDPEGSGVDHWNAMIDVGSDGVVHVAYRTRTEKPSLSNSIDTYYQQSADHGATWSEPLKVNAVTTDVGYCAFSRNGCFLGDYNQVATASNGLTYVVHNEAYARNAGDPCNCSFTQGNSFTDASGTVQPRINQTTWVGVVGNGPSPDVPEAPWAALLVAAGVAVMAISLRRRRVAAV
jgi:hypothetical protein